MKKHQFLLFLFILLLVNSCKKTESNITIESTEPYLESNKPTTTIDSDSSLPSEKGSVQSQEAIRIILNQPDEKQSFIIQDVYLGTNKTFVPAVNIELKKNIKPSNKNLIKISSEVSKAMIAYKLAEQNIIFRRKNHPYAIVYYAGKNKHRTAIELDTVSPKLKLAINDLKFKIDKRKEEKLINHQILKVYLNVDSGIINNHYTMMLITKTTDNTYYSAFYNSSGWVSNVSPINFDKEKYIRDVTLGYTVNNGSGRTNQQQFKLTYFNDLVLAETAYENFADNYFTGYFIEVKL